MVFGQVDGEQVMDPASKLSCSSPKVFTSASQWQMRETRPMAEAWNLFLNLNNPTSQVDLRVQESPHF